MSFPRVLLTGAAGFIGSHTWLALLAAGFRVVGLDDFSNSSPEVLTRLRTLSGSTPEFVRGDVRHAGALDAVFARERIDAVVHFAAFKAVGESVSKPLAYYANNVGGLLALCEAMERQGCKTRLGVALTEISGKCLTGASHPGERTAHLLCAGCFGPM